MSYLGDKIHNKRIELGMTLEAVGQAVGVGKSTVRKWENGTIKNMKNDKILKLAKVLQLNPVELVPQETMDDMLFHRYTAEHSIAEYNRISDELELSPFPRYIRDLEEGDTDILKAAHENKQLKQLFIRLSNMTPDDLQKALQMMSLMFPEE